MRHTTKIDFRRWVHWLQWRGVRKFCIGMTRDQQTLTEIGRQPTESAGKSGFAQIELDAYDFSSWVFVTF